MEYDEIQTDETFEDLYKGTPLRRILKHHMLDSYSFQYLSKTYLIVVPIVVLLILMSIRIGVFALLLSKTSFVPYTADQVESFRQSNYLGISLSAIPQVIVWAVLIYGLMLLLGGKGKFWQSVSIYSIAQIPVVIGSLVLLFVALGQPPATIQTSIVDFEIFLAFNNAFHGYNLANNIILPITSLYTNIIAGVGLSTEHKVPALVGIIVGIMAFIASMLFAYLI